MPPERFSPDEVVTRYPGLAEPVTEEHHQEAVTIAEAVVQWVAEHMEGQT